MSVILQLSPIHFFHFFFFFFSFSFFEFSFINLKDMRIKLFSIQREIIITSLLKKVAEISTNNLKIHIKVVSVRLEISKITISE